MKQILVIVLSLLQFGTVFLEMVQALGGDLKTEDYDQFDIDARSLSNPNKKDAFLTVPQLLRKYGYSCDTHEVQTEDGYFLTLHRIPKVGATPVFLMHGILDSSAGWVVAGQHSSLAYYLSDLGYDVWMGNARGNRYSRKHKNLNSKNKKFWDFSFHEIGKIDVPTMIDFVLNKTGYDQTHYVGHSQGTTSFFVMCDQRPDYCKKIRSMNALAPIAYLRYVRSPLLIALAPFSKQLEKWGKLLGMHEFLPNDDIFKMAGLIMCKDKAVTQAVCYNSMFLVTGYNSQELNKTTLPTVLGHIPAGSSTKQLIHYGQLVGKNYFRRFDYGLKKNQARYGSKEPPSYDLSKTTAPVALHYSLNDWLSHTKDVLKLIDGLPNVAGQYLVPNPKFNHMDFLIGISSREAVYKKVVEVLKFFDNK